MSVGAVGRATTDSSISPLSHSKFLNLNPKTFNELKEKVAQFSNNTEPETVSNTKKSLEYLLEYVNRPKVKPTAVFGNIFNTIKEEAPDLIQKCDVFIENISSSNDPEITDEELSKIKIIFVRSLKDVFSTKSAHPAVNEVLSKEVKAIEDAICALTSKCDGLMSKSIPSTSSNSNQSLTSTSTPPQSANHDSKAEAASDQITTRPHRTRSITKIDRSPQQTAPESGVPGNSAPQSTQSSASGYTSPPRPSQTSEKSEMPLLPNPQNPITPPSSPSPAAPISTPSTPTLELSATPVAPIPAASAPQNSLIPPNARVVVKFRGDLGQDLFICGEGPGLGLGENAWKKEIPLIQGDDHTWFWPSDLSGPISYKIIVRPLNKPKIWEEGKNHELSGKQDKISPGFTGVAPITALEDCKVTRLTIKCTVEPEMILSLYASDPALGKWEQRNPLRQLDPTTWVFDTDKPIESFECKVVKHAPNSSTPAWETGSNHKVVRGEKLLIEPKFS